MIAATKALISAIAAGGWVAVLVILIICIIGLICASIFGIFFSNETGSKTMTSVIRETNSEVYMKIENIKRITINDQVEVESTYSNWREVIAIYSVKYSEDGKNNIIVIDDDNVSKVKKVFWDMNEIKHEVIRKQVKNEQNNMLETKMVLKINVVSKTKEELMKQYGFSDEQKKQVNELLSKEYDSLWLNLIYGSSSGNAQIVEVAKQQVGNVGGEPYWRWYGFNSRIEWCAAFVSWCANEVGLIKEGKIPKFAGVATGISWFKERGEWQEKGYSPRPGDIIFFDWEVDEKANHVGIVEKVENGIIHTVEGNSTNDSCREKQYDINSKVIFGFGVPAY